MKVSDQDIAQLNEHLAFKLNQMRDYHALTVSLLNCEVGQVLQLLEARRHIIDEVNAADLRIKRCLSVAEDASLSAVAQALRGREVFLQDARFSGALTQAKQIYILLKDISIIDKKLITKTEKERGGMVEELKGMSGQRRVVDTLYFTAKPSSVGARYDFKK